MREVAVERSAPRPRKFLSASECGNAVTSLRFEWDLKKAAANRAQHGVSFKESLTGFWALWLAFLPMRIIHLRKHARLSLDTQ